MKYSNNLKNLAEELVQYATRKGASECQVSITEGTEFSVELREGKIERLVEAGSKSLAFKVIVDNKVATASSSDFTTETLNGLIENAIKRAKLSSADPFSGLPELEPININVESLDLYDNQVVEMAAEDKIKFARELEEICLKDKRIKLSAGSAFFSNIGEYILANSKGFIGSYKGTSCGAGVQLQAGSDDNPYEDGWWDSCIHLKDLLSVEEIAKIAVHRTTRMIGAKKIATQNVPVVLEPTMTSRILGFLSGCVSGAAIYLNQSFLTGKINTKIADEKVNIIDNGLIPRMPGSRPFDAEGVPTRITPIIESGMLVNYLLDTYSARKLDMKSNGHAGSPTNFYLMPGNYAPEDIIKSVDKGLFLTNTIGQGTVPTTGDISTGAYGLWIENGEIAYPVSEITISGNLGKILSEIEMIGNDIDYKRQITGPTIKIKELTISGL